jgi:hypothetical protein
MVARSWSPSSEPKELLSRSPGWVSSCC